MLLNHETIDDNYEDFPGFTRWHYGKYFCIKKAIFIDKLPNNIFLGHWDFQPGFPIAVSLIIISSYFFGMTAILSGWRIKAGLIVGFFLSITFILFIYSLKMPILVIPLIVSLACTYVAYKKIDGAALVQVNDMKSSLSSEQISSIIVDTNSPFVDNHVRAKLIETTRRHK